MHDKVLGFIRETLLHDNLFDDLTFNLRMGEVRLRLLQPPRDYTAYPDPQLTLIFSGVRDVSASASAPDRGGQAGYGEDLLGIECTYAGGRYRAAITFGNPGTADWSVRIDFEALRYVRS